MESGLDPASPARSLAQASDQAGPNQAGGTRGVSPRVHALCEGNYFTFAQCNTPHKMRQRRKKTKTDLPVPREAEMRWRISGRCLLPPILFPSPSVSDPLLSCSFSLFCIFFRLCWKWLRQWPTFSFFA